MFDAQFGARPIMTPCNSFRFQDPVNGNVKYFDLVRKASDSEESKDSRDALI